MATRREEGTAALEILDWESVRESAVGQRIRWSREKRGLTQQQLADELAKHGVRVSVNTISNLEVGRQLSPQRLIAIAAVCQVSVTFLLHLVDTPGAWVPKHPLEVLATRRKLTGQRDRPKPDLSLHLGEGRKPGGNRPLVTALRGS